MDDLNVELMVPEEGHAVPGCMPVKKRSALPLVPRVTCIEGVRETGYHTSTRWCLRRIRDAMLHHRWQEAAEFLSSYCQSIEDTVASMPSLAAGIIWRVGTEILHHHPNSKMENYNSFYDRVKNVGVMQYLVVCLEHAFHFLVNGQLEDARRQLSIAESWRFGKQSANQSQRLSLIQGYRGYLDYFIWREKTSTVSSTDDPDAATNQEMESYFRQSSISLKEAIKTPGVWDPFVRSYVDMLEFYDDHEGVLAVLEEYAYDSRYPSNPNAHVYLYRYLKKHDFPRKRLIAVLKILHDIVPSHELMLEYCSLLLQSERPCDLQAALRVTLDLLDYACWRSRLDVWNQLKGIIERLNLIGNGPDMIEEVMTPKKDWWPSLHFTPFHARQESALNLDIVEIKIFVEKFLCPFTTVYHDTVKGAPERRNNDDEGRRKTPTYSIIKPNESRPRKRKRKRKPKNPIKKTKESNLINEEEKQKKRLESKLRKAEKKMMERKQMKPEKKKMLRKRREREKIREERDLLKRAMASLKAREALEKAASRTECEASSSTSEGESK